LEIAQQAIVEAGKAANFLIEPEKAEEEKETAIIES
jgi:hypothetical protein